MIIREHWYYENGLNSLVHSMYDIHVHGATGMDPNNLLYGLPYGCWAILYIKHIKCKFTPVDVGSSRCCAVIMEFPDLTKLLLFNVYMPCDTARNVNNNDIYREVLSNIRASCNVQDIDFMIIGGDFNTDLARTESQNTHSLNSIVFL